MSGKAVYSPVLQVRSGMAREELILFIILYVLLFFINFTSG
jgi:nitrate reductase NapE component